MAWTTPFDLYRLFSSNEGGGGQGIVGNFELIHVGFNALPETLCNPWIFEFPFPLVPVGGGGQGQKATVSGINIVHIGSEAVPEIGISTFEFVQ